jgi:hypothetical protein
MRKSRELDRYRWCLLRERHGVLGSTVRFAREMLSDLLFGVRARLSLARVVEGETCDFLLLQSAPKVIAFQRKKLLMQALRERGHVLIETALPEASIIVRQRLLCAPLHKVPLRYFVYAAHAQWLMARYQPRILLNDRNGSLYAPFLRMALNQRDALLVHMAHATTVEGSSRLGMNDYDYYFLFGQSSLEALQARALRFGISTAVLAGSHMIDGAFDLPASEPERRVMLILGVGPDKEKEPGYQRTYVLLQAWALQNPSYRLLIKAHPRSAVPFWHEAAARSTQVEVLPRDCGLADALKQASIVINIMSNAVIEAALARRPVLYVNAGEQQDIFSQEQFFGTCITDVEQLQQRVLEIEAGYADCVSAAERFADYHLAQGSQGLLRNLQLLEQLQRTGHCEGVCLPPAHLTELSRTME